MTEQFSLSAAKYLIYCPHNKQYVVVEVGGMGSLSKWYIVKQWKERLGEQYMNTSQAEGIDQLQSWVNESKRIVFFGGAGVSTESGIPDFRSVDGLYHQKYD